MSGVLKTIGTIAGIAGAVLLAVPTAGTSLLGLSAIGAGFLGTALTVTAMVSSVGSSLLAGRPEIPSVSAATTDRLNVSIDLNTPRKIIFGHTAMATDLRDQELTDDQTYLHRFIVAAAHSVQSIEELWFDDKLAWSASGGITADYAGYLDVTVRTEGNAGNAINISGRMGSSRRFTGCAYLHVRYRLTGTNKKSESPFAQTIPTRVTIIGRGAAIYDPRLDSTVPGGSGPQRANDQSTWTWNENAARNPALQLLWYYLGWRIHNPVTGEWLLSVGKGVPPRRLNLASFITAANLCDETVIKADGGTEARYRSDGIFSEGDPTRTVTDQLKASMNAELDDVDGKIRITVLHNDLATPVCDLTTDDVIGAFTWNQTAPLTDTFNILRGTFVDPASLFQTPDFPQIEMPSPDGLDRIETIDFSTVQSVGQAQRLAKQRLARMLYSGTFTAEFSHRAWKAAKNDIVRFSFAPLGWTNVLFRVAEGTTQINGRVPLVLRIEHPDIYLWDNDERPAVRPAVPTGYNPSLNPILQDVLTPRYGDGTPIDNLKPSQPGATNGMSPSEALLLSQLEADIITAELIAAQLQVDAAELANRILAAEGEIASTGDLLETYGSAIESNAIAISNLEGDLASIDLSVVAGGSNLQINGGAEAGLEGYFSPSTLELGAGSIGPYVRTIPAGATGEINGPVIDVLDAAGKTFSASADTSCMSAGSSARLHLVFVNSVGAETGRVSGLARTPHTWSTTGANRTANKASGVAPASTVKMYIQFAATGLDGLNELAFRQLKIEAGDKATFYSADASVRQSLQAVSGLALDMASLEMDLNTLSSSVSTNALAINALDASLGSLTTRVRSNSPNLLKNPSFENGLSSWNGDDSSWLAAANSVWGNLAYKYLGEGGFSDADAYLFQDVPAQANQTYTGAAEIACNNIGGGPGTSFHYIELQFFNGATYLSTASGPHIANPVNFTSNDDGRQAIKCTATTPAGTTMIRFVLRSTVTNAHSINWRRAKLEPGSLASAFSQEAAVSQVFQSVNGALARAAVRLDVGGRMIGWETNNNGVIGDFRIHADYFVIERPGGGARTEYSGGNWRVYDATGVMRTRMGVW